MQDRFSLLEEIKSIKIGNEMTLTLSMGIGTGSAEYSKNYDVAKAAMDLCSWTRRRQGGSQGW